MNKKIVTVISVLGYILLFAGFALILIGYYGIIITDGWGAAFKLLSPFNVVNTLTTIVIMAPGIGLLALAHKLK